MCVSCLVAFALQRLVWSSLGPLSSPCVLQSLCVLVSVPKACPLCCRACVHLFRLTPGLFVSGLMCSSFSCAARVDCVAQVCMPPHSGRSSPTLCAMRVVCTPGVCMPYHTRLPGPALCAARVVCAGWVCMPPHYRFPEPAICLRPQSRSCYAEKCSLLCLK